VSSFSDSSSTNQPIQARLTDAVSAVAQLFERRQLSYALIGGLSVAFRGNKRSTEDIDFLLQVPSVGLPGLLEAMKSDGCDLDLNLAIRQWNSDGMLVIEWPNGVQIDLLKPVIPVFHRILERAKTENFGSQTLRVADAEGLLLLKLIAFRPMDQEDIRGILLANANQIDLNWVRKESRQAGLPNERLEAFEALVCDFYR
jgi:hypothetical protein